MQICEVTANARRGARGLIIPAATRVGSPNESELLPDTARELDTPRLRPREVALDSGSDPGPTNRALPDPAVFHRRWPTALIEAQRAPGWPAFASQPKGA